MIVPMKKVYVIVQAHNNRSMLRELRKAGLLHIQHELSRNEKIEELSKEYDALSSVKSAILDAQDKKHPLAQERVSTEVFVELNERYADLVARSKELEEQRAKDSILIEQLRPWGDFNPKEVAYLSENGIDLFFYTISKKDLLTLDPEIKYLPLAPIGAMQAIATVGKPLDPTVAATQFQLPEFSLSELETRIQGSTQRLSEIASTFASAGMYLDAYSHEMKKIEQAMKFEQVQASVEESDDLVWILGYLPEMDQKTFEAEAHSHAWAYSIENPSEDDNPPTLVKYPKGIGIIKPVFDILGTVPGYRENDISTWFLLFFTLFFAMIIGDAGYGAIFLTVAIILNVKLKKANTAVMLLYVLSTATIVWGSLTGTWFGSREILVAVPFLQQLVIPSISNYPDLFGVTNVTAQNMVMKFCFIIGTVQLSLACVLNVVHKIREKNLSLLADIGWLIDILSLYFVVLQLVVGESANFGLVGKLVGFGFLLVCVFGMQGPGVPFGKGLASGLGGFFTTFLNTISAFSNIMSYIRLFAVGMASVAIAQSFNAMASGMLSGAAMVAGILILVIGHSLNLVMGLLSVVVHGVRLNLLEFSGQLGMEWTGIAYEPFAQTVQEN